ncbi:type II secretion system protein [bacterium]|nr:type II secretion system protein [bacterium]
MRKAFTLAEVLITIGVIGVVAAITIPTLMTKIQGAKFRNQFKKSFSTLKQANRMSQAKYDFNFADLENFECDNPATDNPETNHTVCAILNGTITGLTYLGKGDDVKDSKGNTYNITPEENGNYVSTIFLDEYYLYSLADGSLVGISTDSAAEGFIDVNGVSLPNKIVSCSDNQDTNDAWFAPSPAKVPCTVPNDAKHMTDVFRIYFPRPDGKPNDVVPATNASMYVLNTAK